MTGPLIVCTLAALFTGYTIGRTRPGQRLLTWAEGRFYGPHGPGWWIAQAIGLAAILWMIAAHPRRSAANRRSWRDARAAPRSPAPALDPDWATHRQETQP